MPASQEVNALFVVNRFVDGSFIYDMFIQFNLAYQTEAGTWVFDKTAIRCRYLSFWFWIDTVSVLPLWIISFLLGGGVADDTNGLAAAVANNLTSAADAKSAAEM